MPRLTLNDTGLLPSANEEPYYMPAGTDWCELDGIFADPDDDSWLGMYGYWKVGGYAIATMNTRGDCLVRVEWDEEKKEGILVPVIGGPHEPLPYKSSDKRFDPVVRARMIGLLEVLAWVSQ